MMDDTFRGLAALDHPAEPDPEWADRLFSTLAVELLYRDPPRPSGAWLGLRRRLGIEAAGPARTALRLAYVAALLGLLIAATAAALFVAGQLLGQSPAELVRQSQAVYDAPPAFVMEVENSEGARFLVSTDGAGTWRTEQFAGPGSEVATDGWFWLYTPGRRATYDPTLNTWDVQDVAAGADPAGVFPPYPLQTEFAWNVVPEPAPGVGSRPATARLECPTWETIGEEPVAGRPAHHLRCRERDQHFWIDRESRLVLAVEAGPATPGWSPGYRIEATALSFGPADAVRFAWAGPPGSISPDELPVATRLISGEAPPRWTGALLDGTSFDTAALTGTRTAILFWATWCEPCHVALRDRIVPAAEAHPESATITVGAIDTAADLRRFTEAEGIGLPVVVDDPDGAPTLMSAWGITSIPALVLLEADGTVAGTLIVVPEADIEAVLAAFAAGEPLP